MATGSAPVQASEHHDGPFGSRFFPFAGGGTELGFDVGGNLVYKAMFYDTRETVFTVTD